MGAATTDLQDRLAVAAGVLNVANAHLIEIVAEALETKQWQGEGIHSPAHWLAWQAGVSPGHARELVAVAEKRSQFPVVIAAFERGELAVDQVAAVVKGAPAWADAKVLYLATQCTVAQLKKVMRARFFDDGTPDQPDTPKPVDRLSTSHTDEARWRISGEADPEAGAIIDAALDEARDALFRGGDTDVTNIDALVEIARRSLAAVGSVSRRENHRINLHLDANANLVTTAGWKLPSAIAERILCDTGIVPVWERQGIPFNQGRTTRVIPKHVREAVRRRDKGSRAPWDTSTKHTEVHHIKPWSHGGETNTANLIEISQRIHDLIHQAKLSVEGNADDPNGLIWRDANGRILDNNGKPIPPTSMPTPVGQYQHPNGGRLDCSWLGWVHDDQLTRRQQTTTTRPTTQ
jgi:hypothetical protein